MSVPLLFLFIYLDFICVPQHQKKIEPRVSQSVLQSCCTRQCLVLRCYQLCFLFVNFASAIPSIITNFTIYEFPCIDRKSRERIVSTNIHLLYSHQLDWTLQFVYFRVFICISIKHKMFIKLSIYFPIFLTSGNVLVVKPVPS